MKSTKTCTRGPGLRRGPSTIHIEDFDDDEMIELFIRIKEVFGRPQNVEGNSNKIVIKLQSTPGQEHVITEAPTGQEHVITTAPAGCAPDPEKTGQNQVPVQPLQQPPPEAPLTKLITGVHVKQIKGKSRAFGVGTVEQIHAGKVRVKFGSQTRWLLVEMRSRSYETVTFKTQ